MSAAAPLLSVEGVTIGYGHVRVVRDLSLAVAANSVTALVGSNAAGKSTLLRTVAGLLQPEAGAIRLDGADMVGSRCHERVERGIVLVPEGRLLFPLFTVEENLKVGAFAPHARADAARQAEAMYALFPRLKERRRQLAGTLSGGEQQMLAIARGLMARPRLLLLDEPTLGLAPLAATAIFELVGRLRDSGLTIMLAEQDVRRTLGVADHAYVLENGHCTLSGPARALLADPKVKASYLGGVGV
ncbi:MAG: ABC transporter ATP-binding protein [Candidatus Eiseniibacteriota bacterium]